MPRVTDSTFYVGIDPGQSGGLALLGNGYGVVSLVPIPSSYKDLLDWFLGAEQEAFAVIERVHSMPKQGVASSFTFGKGVGALLMALTAAKIPHEEIDPRKWQKGLGITPRKKGEAKPQFKKRLQAFAEKLFPRTEGITMATCDALLISEFCRRYREGKL